MTRLVLLLCIITQVFAAKLPSSFTKCNRKQANFEECLTKAVENAVQQLVKPMEEVGLPNMEPLEIPELNIDAGSGAVSFAQNYKNLKVGGYSKTKCAAAKFDFDKKTLTIECTMPQAVMDFDYEINGRILLLPIFGKGRGTIILDEVRIPITFTLDDYDKNGKAHYKVVAQKMLMEPQKIQFKLRNLFNGNKALGDTLNAVMSQNWKQVFADVKPGYEKAFGQIYYSIFNQLLEKVPVNELFDDE